MISSVAYSDKEVLESFKKLYLNGENFDLDPCFSEGNFYKEIPEPIHKSDLNATREDVVTCDCRKLPFADKSFNSIIFDPPFMFGTHGQTKNNIMNKRFTMFDTFEQLVEVYEGSLMEFYRILKPKGYLFFKCQDYTDSRTTMTHCFVWEWALKEGFYAKDIFILVSRRGRIFNPNLVQRHARKFHCYWFVFQK